MAGRAQRSAEDGADAARADDAHPQVGHLNLFRSRPSDHLSGERPVWVPDYFTVFNVNGTQMFRSCNPTAP